MYVITEQYREFKDRIRQAENSMQLGTNTPEQDGLTEKFSKSGNDIYFKRKDRLVKFVRDRSVGIFEVSALLGDGVYEITNSKQNFVNVYSERLTKYTSERGMVPVVRTGQARSTLPALIRPFKGKEHEDVLF
ncbi:hypothetical protein AYI69_g6098 [Smittium culicis]|uniref:Uncharacterized protein n=1 Tax=Smittium culicis TaxID=133412 RepID=A0A1R1Y1N6_9FUNG|nr:hypothetical protein AYI69_g6098 [Smittium culicis]